MKRLVIVAGLVLASFGAAPGARAEFYSGQTVRDKLRLGCDDRRCDYGDNLDFWAAWGYVLGVHDSLTTVTVCAPDSVKAGQVISITRRYLEVHPEQWNYSADRLIGRALSDVWPCAPEVEGARPRQY